MDYIISHISALEYWRAVGRNGIALPGNASRAAVPRSLPHPSIFRETSACLSLPMHVLCSRKQKNRPHAGVVGHQTSSNLPAGSIRILSAHQGITSPEMTLMQMASLLTMPELAGLICEFCGSFSIQDEIPHGMFSRKPLTTVRKVQAFAAATSGLAGIDSLRTAARYALDGSRSPAETAAGLLLTLPRMRGGYGLQGAKLNQTIPLKTKARAIAQVAELEPDIIWPAARICIEYDSKEFHRDERRIANDARRKNALLLSNLHVVTLTNLQLSNRREMDKVAKHVATSMGKRWTSPHFQKQVTLRNELLGATSAIRRSQELLDRSGQVPRAAAIGGEKQSR